MIEDFIKDLFDDFFKRDREDVFFRIREDNFYPTYGDDSIITNANSYLQQGKIFGQLEYKKSSIMWGTYGTGLSGPEFSQVNRTLYGAKGELISSKTIVLLADGFRMLFLNFFGCPTDPLARNLVNGFVASLLGSGLVCYLLIQSTENVLPITTIFCIQLHNSISRGGGTSEEVEDGGFLRSQRQQKSD